MNKFTLLVLLAIFVCCKSSKTTGMDSKNTASKNEKSAGWKSLFDGKTTSGWHTYGMAKAGNQWKVEDGVLHLDSKTTHAEKGDLVTDEEFENFDLQLDWKISEKGNSGIIFYVQDDPPKYPDTYETGIEMQILDNGTPTSPGHPDAKIYTHRAGDLYDLLASKEAVHPQGEWNRVEIKCENGRLDFYMNGQHVLKTVLWDDNWNKMVEISKFKKLPDFAKFKKGKIALQDHGGDVWFRNIRIKKL